MRSFLFLLILGIIFHTSLAAQNIERKKGPIIVDFGSVFSIENPDFKTNPNKVYKVIFDVHDTPKDRTKVNPLLNTLARFLNMHAQAGVPLENLQVACVIHNKATHDVLNNEGYKEKFGVDNPNIPLLKALEKAGAKIYICGQSISARGVDRTKIARPVKVALSAITVILSYQSEGYQLIRF